MSAIRVIAALAGIALLSACFQDVFEAVLLPRRVERRWRFMFFFFRGMWRFWSFLARRVATGRKRESLIAIFGPLSMVLLFSCWGISLIIGFALLQWSLPAGSSLLGLARQIDLSADAFFTLGLENVITRPQISLILVFLEAGTGFGFIALMVSYLPVLYQHFSQRDARLIQLDSRAGTPATAGTLLYRYATTVTFGEMRTWLHDWETWAADLIESHSAYPMLAFYRSQHESQSWLATLAVILDSCTYLLCFSSKELVMQSGASFRVARGVLKEICVSLGVVPLQPDRLTRRYAYDDLLRLNNHLAAASRAEWCEVKTIANPLDLQMTYEPMLQALSTYLLLPLPGFLAAGPHPLPYAGVDHRSALIERLLGQS